MAVMNRRVVPESPQKIVSEGSFRSPDRVTHAIPSFHLVVTPIFESAWEVASVSSHDSGECSLLSPCANAEQNRALWV
jgi:hypothetical protein